MPQRPLISVLLAVFCSIGGACSLLPMPHDSYNALYLEPVRIGSWNHSNAVEWDLSQIRSGYGFLESYHVRSITEFLSPNWMPQPANYSDYTPAFRDFAGDDITTPKVNYSDYTPAFEEFLRDDFSPRQPSPDDFTPGLLGFLNENENRKKGFEGFLGSGIRSSFEGRRLLL